jgi:hypothetical protein
MNRLETLYHAMDIRNKIPIDDIRYLYLRDIWGMEQTAIAKCEYRSQGFISTALKQARGRIPEQSFKDNINNLFSVDEIKKLQFMPRIIIGDVQVMSFIMDVLGLEIAHPFFQFYVYQTNTRITALAKMGVRQVRLQEIFNKNQSTISMTIKRLQDSVEKYESSSRYDSTADYKLLPKTTKQAIVVSQNKFIPAGGQVW